MSAVGNPGPSLWVEESVYLDWRWQQLRVQHAFGQLAANRQASLSTAAAATAFRHTMLRQQLRDALHSWQAWARQHHAVASLRAKLKAQLILRILHFWHEWAGMHHALQGQGVLCQQQHEAAVKRRAVISWQHVASSLTCRRAWHCLAAKWRRSLLLHRALRVWIRCVRQMQVHIHPEPALQASVYKT